MANTTVGRTQFVIIWVSMSASKSCRKSVANQEKDTTGRLIQALNICLKMKAAFVDDHVDFEGSNKWKVTRQRAHFILRLSMMARNWTSPKFQIAIPLPTRLTLMIMHRRPFNLHLQQHFQTTLGNINRQNMFEIHRHLKRRAIMNIKRTQAMRTEVRNEKFEKSSFFSFLIDPNLI